MINPNPNPNCRTCYKSSKTLRLFIQRLYEKVCTSSDLEKITSSERIHDTYALCSKIAHKEISFLSLRSASPEPENFEQFKSFFFKNEIDSSIFTYIEVLDAFFFYLESLQVLSISLNEIFLACFLFVMRTRHLNKLTESVIKEGYEKLGVNTVNFTVSDISIFMYLQLVKPQSCFVDVLMFLTDNYFKYLKLIQKSRKGVPKKMGEGECRFKTVAILISMRFYCYMKERNHFSQKNSLLYNYFIIFYIVINYLSQNEEDKHHNLTIMIILMEELKIEFQDDVKEHENLFNNFVKLYDY